MSIPRYRISPFGIKDDPEGKFCEYRDYLAMKQDRDNLARHYGVPAKLRQISSSSYEVKPTDNNNIPPLRTGGSGGFWLFGFFR